mmetsp:Transcript_42527/g.77202  ORF Transcript_42527/g.77202 Transcript_42527/m.77202 type:complete len:230 (-) Transcript_42527:951-1640(-)
MRRGVVAPSVAGPVAGGSPCFAGCVDGSRDGGCDDGSLDDSSGCFGIGDTGSSGGASCARTTRLPAGGEYERVGSVVTPSGGVHDEVVASNCLHAEAGTVRLRASGTPKLRGLTLGLQLDSAPRTPAVLVPITTLLPWGVTRQVLIAFGDCSGRLGVVDGLDQPISNVPVDAWDGTARIRLGCGCGGVCTTLVLLLLAPPSTFCKPSCGHRHFNEPPVPRATPGCGPQP